MIDKNKFFEKYALATVVGVAILTVIIILALKLGPSDYDRQNKPKAKTELDIRCDTLTNRIWEVFDSTERFVKTWSILAKLKAAEDSYYGVIDINLDTHPLELPNNGIQISTTKFLIPSPKSNAKKDSKHGLPQSFYYKFIFNGQNKITNKYVVVQYDKDTAVVYDFDFSPIKNLLNRDIANSKLRKWHNEIQKLTNEQQRQIKEDQRKQSETRNKNCKEEKKFITDVYNMLLNSLAELEYQYQYLPDEEFGIYVAQWNRNAKAIREQYSIKSFDCFFVFDYNHILGDYQSAGLEMAYISMGSSPDNYIFFKSRMKKYYRYLMDSYKNKK
mgnify:CR=1 FL=1